MVYKDGGVGGWWWLHKVCGMILERVNTLLRKAIHLDAGVHPQQLGDRMGDEASHLPSLHMSSEVSSDIMSMIPDFQEQRRLNQEVNKTQQTNCR